MFLSSPTCLARARPSVSNVWPLTRSPKEKFTSPSIKSAWAIALVSAAFLAYVRYSSPRARASSYFPSSWAVEVRISSEVAMPQHPEGGDDAPRVLQFPEQPQALSTERLCLRPVALLACEHPGAGERPGSYRRRNPPWGHEHALQHSTSRT